MLHRDAATSPGTRATIAIKLDWGPTTVLEVAHWHDKFSSDKSYTAGCP